ncbi:hypothetical protein [Cetobacterium sp.]|uniref:hypothetical protein n=1 Tax=Cetobacterium sp. TaxID=2071632 RepID=UPI003EE554E7
MVSSENIKNFFEWLNNNSIKYVLIKNDEEHIPYRVLDGDDIDILVHPSDYDRYLKLIQENGYKVLSGESSKYYFIYNMRKDIYAEKEDVYIHAYDKLSCVSFTNMGLSKIPLDKKIQEFIWKTKKWDSKNKWWIADDRIILLYLIIRAIFDKKNFRERYIYEIEKRKKIITDLKFRELCNLVFFKFTPTLLELIKNREYDVILKKYRCFKDY